MQPVGAVRLVPSGEVCKQVFEAEVKNKGRVKAKWANYVGQLFAGC